MHRGVCIALALALAAAAAGAQEVEPVFPLEEVAAGQRGTGWSVFHGSEPEAFEVEVLGVWRDAVAPETSYILARLSGRGLEETGVVAGMSGSPVYVDDRLLGAVSFGFPTAQEAIAGITPIESMRRLHEAAVTPPPPGLGSGAVDLAALARAELPPDLLRQAWSRLAPRSAGQGSGLLWAGAGFGPEGRALLGEALGGELAPAGHAAQLAGEFAPGAAVAAVLMDGDLQLAVTGTLTSRRGEEVLAFGHPFLGRGDVRLPMARAEVVTVVGSRVQSFKLANLGPIVGAFDLDRAAGLRGRLGLEAPMVPLTVAVRGSREADVELRLAEVPQLLPALAAIGLVGAVDATTQAAGVGTLDLSARLELAGQAPILLEQAFDGDGATLQAALYLLALTGLVVDNVWGEVDLASIAVEARQGPDPRGARLLGAHAERRVVRPGERLAIDAELAPFRGAPFRQRLEIEVPEALPDGPYFVLVGDGASADGARLALEKAAPETLDQVLALVRSLTSRRELVALGLRPAAGLRVAGEALPGLPGSVRSLWQAGDPASVQALELALEPLASVRLPAPATGLTRVDLEVRRDPSS
jgi:hypothetical protein